MDYMLGEIQRFPYNFIPYGWVECNGQFLSVNNNQALFSLIGNKFGGDGYNTFAVPDLRNTAIPESNLRYCIAIQGIYPSRP